MEFKKIKVIQYVACVPILLATLLAVNDFGFPDYVKKLVVFLLIFAIVVSVLVGRFNCPKCGEKFHIKPRPHEGTYKVVIRDRGFRNTIFRRFVPFARQCVHCGHKPIK